MTQPGQREIPVHSYNKHKLRHTKHNATPFTYQTVSSEHGTNTVCVCVCVCVREREREREFCNKCKYNLRASAAVPFQ